MANLNEADDQPTPMDEGTDGEELSLTEQLINCVRIDPQDLQTEFVRLPSDVAYWNEQYSDAIEMHLRAKLAFDTAKASCLLGVKAASLELGEKITVGEVDARVVSSDVYQEAAARMVETEANKLRLRNRVDSLQAKRDMLQSLGAQLRVEMSMDPRVLEEIRGRKEIESR